MALSKETIGSRLVLVVQTGTDGDGKPILRSTSFSRVDTTALDENVHAVALAMAELQEHTLVAVRRVDDHKLSDV
ncbi:MAG TPA: hypothetical protein DDZ53_08315 [Firmicutes bacterium]|jgi:hypothetical protein|nr:hypothetical protein [Bacillota bacterium]